VGKRVLCALCRRVLPQKDRPKLKGARRYVHEICDLRAAEWVKDSWESLPDPRTFRK
jgi:hypothetical protein